MHQYSTDTTRPFRIGIIGMFAFFMAVLINNQLAPVISPLLSEVLSENLAGVALENLFTVSLISFFTLSYGLYRFVIWRWAYKFGIEDIPNLQGEWLQIPVDGDVDDLPVTDDCQVELVKEEPKLIIKQTWDKMSIGYLNEGFEYWSSDTAMIRTDDAPNAELIFTYRSEPLNDEFTYRSEPLDDEETQGDRGTVRLRYVSDDGPDQLTGMRYTETGMNDEQLTFVKRDPIMNELDEYDI